MAAFDYAEMAALALELLTEFGDDATITRIATKTLAADGSATGAADASVTVKCLEIVAGTRLGLANAGAMSSDGDVRNFSATHIIEAMADPAKTGDRLVFNGRTLAIKDVRTVRPSGTALCHFINAGNP